MPGAGEPTSKLSQVAAGRPQHLTGCWLGDSSLPRGLLHEPAPQDCWLLPEQVRRERELKDAVRSPWCPTLGCDVSSPPHSLPPGRRTHTRARRPGRRAPGETSQRPAVTGGEPPRFHSFTSLCCRGRGGIWDCESRDEPGSLLLRRAWKPLGWVLLVGQSPAETQKAGDARKPERKQVGRIQREQTAAVKAC